MQKERQYIGARYVIAVYKNSNNPNSAEWEANTHYEPLTLVTYQNSSYLSRKDVPSTVGNPAANGAYWCVTGNYNGQIAELQNLINSLSGELAIDMENIQNGLFLTWQNIVAYGDSTVYRGAGEDSYLDYVADAVGATFTNRAVPGSNMTSGANNGVSLINASTDLNNFDVCFLGYGIAEWAMGLTKEEVDNRIYQIVAAVLAKNAHMTIIFNLPFYVYNETLGNNYDGVRNARGMTINDFNHWCIETLDRLGVPHINFYERSTCSATTYTIKLLNDSGGIYYHPTEEFKKELASIVLNGCDITEEENLVPMFSNVEFTTARYRVQFSDIQTAGGLYNGYAMIVNAGETVKSAVKILKRGSYVLHGVCDKPITVKMDNSHIYSIAAGEFNLSIERGTGAASVEVTAGNEDTFINEFQLYARNPYDDMAINGFKAYTNATLVHTTGITSLVDPHSHISGENLVIESFAFTISDNSSIEVNDTLYRINNNYDCGTGTTYLLGFSNSSDLLILVATGNNLKFGNVPPAGTYFFDTKLIAPAPQHYTG